VLHLSHSQTQTMAIPTILDTCIVRRPSFLFSVTVSVKPQPQRRALSKQASKQVDCWQTASESDCWARLPFSFPTARASSSFSWTNRGISIGQARERGKEKPRLEEGRGKVVTELEINPRGTKGGMKYLSSRRHPLLYLIT